ncbi:zinc finger CCHC domain-containing protein 8 homolog isoform X2 [Chelonus insularis]|nr:zinc finger CCHC domain-containing protein 8 homolog isoform X2 [Chelonus insularis]XP_034946228.1 zinc finger CCHC domain-containing protein 8 homolog isoform X2 [Chelonus insularis]
MKQMKKLNTNETLIKEEPLIKVIFQNHKIASQYRKKIKDFLQDLLSVTLPKECVNCTDLILEINKTDLNSNNNSEHSTIDDEPLFMIDSTPAHHGTLDIPIYGKKFERVLTETHDNASEEIDCKSPKLNCFNCLGNHNLRDCTEPKNHFTINKNRKEFMNKTGTKNSRYHLDQKFQPGIISSELKKALGLANDELPKHIYKMRLLGYPPGWLEEAKLEHSGLNLYNSDGHREMDPKEELDEIFCRSSVMEYDLKKIYDFPGYNVPPPAGIRDEYWSADQQTFHSKAVMLQMLKHQKAEDVYKRKKFKKISETRTDDIIKDVSKEIESSKDNLTLINGDHSSNSKSTGELSDSLSLDSEKVITTCISSQVNGNDVSINLSSLVELETRKKYLLQELNDSHSLLNPKLLKTTNNLIIEKSSLDDTHLNSPIDKKCDNIAKVGSVKSIELGTPLIERVSIYNKLPSSEKFSKNICDVINFENLPETTGKYEKMNDIIQKIRSTLTPKRNQ